MRLSNGVRWLAVAAALLTSGNLAAQSTASLTGHVTDESGAALSGVQIVITNQNNGTQNGALSQNDGRFLVVGLRPGGPYRVEARMIGYGLQAVDAVTLAAGETRSIDFRLSQEAVAIDAIEVFATRAIERKTPVAYADVKKVQIQNQLGSQDLPMVLNVTPSVYATMQGGGAGDARINVRGFSQRNTAVMVNGVPVNDMENGWVYWSNWDGLGDAATSIQLQRGLSAVNLATPSIGGTMNIITDPSTSASGLSYKQEFGSGAFLKETFTANTGEHNGFSLTASVTRKTGDGLWGYTGAERTSATDQGFATYTDAWAYYVGASYQINTRNRLEFYAVGAPQEHGQNLYKLNIATFDHQWAIDKFGYSQAALDAFPEAGRFYSPNVGPVSASYAGKQYASSGPKTGMFDRYGKTYLNERENFFHKPQVNLNYYSYFGSGLSWTTVAYYSGGNGGGSGTLGSLKWHYDYTQRYADWDATIAQNQANSTGSRGILRASVNNQWTIGTISKLRKDFSSGVTGEVGIDWRTASIDHYRDVRDLLGGAYWLDKDNEFTGNRQATFGDKIDYYNTNKVDWLGAYVQAEKSDADGSLYGMFGWAQNAYNFTDHFVKGTNGQELKLESGNISGYQVKGGINRNLTEQWSVFGNAGYVSKVPILDGVIDDVQGTLNPNPKNETFASFEAGVNYRSLDRGVDLSMNFYHTTWKNQTKALYVPNEDITANVLGMNERHMGLELQGAWQPSDILRLDASASFGDWWYLDDATGKAVSGDRQTSTEYAFYIKDVKVSDQPQTQFAYALSLFPADGLYLNLQGRSSYNYYAAFDPFSRTTQDYTQSWKVPGSHVFDFHGSYRINDLIPAWKGGDVRLFANVFNLFDTWYIQDATDNSSYNAYKDDGGHDANSAEVYLGGPRTFNIGFQVIF